MKKNLMKLALCLLLAFSASPALAQNVGLNISVPVTGSQNVIYGNNNGGAGAQLLLLQNSGSNRFFVDTSGNMTLYGTGNISTPGYFSGTVRSNNICNSSGGSCFQPGVGMDATPDTIADDGVISSGEVNFNYADSGSKGGAANNSNALGGLSSSAFLRAGTQSPAGNAEIAASDNGSYSYSVAGLELRETNYGGSSSYLPPRLAFHWGGVVASQLTIESDGKIAVVNNPGTSYENFRANNFYSQALGAWLTDRLGQDVRSGSSPTFGEVYTTGWFRNNDNNEGLYNQNNGNHWYSDGTYWKAGNNNSGAGGIQLRYGHEGSLKGYVYWDGSGFGLLHSGGGWGVMLKPGSDQLYLPGNVGIGTTDTSSYKIYARGSNGSDWLYRFNNDANGSNVHMLYGAGYGIHVNAGSNASTGTYIFEGYGAGASRFYVNGVGDLRVGASSDRYVDAGRLYLNNSAWHGWGTSIIDGRVWSANSNIHLSPPTGYNVVINTDYRDAGGSTGTAGLTVSGSGTFGQRLSVGQSNPGYTLSSIDTSGSGSNMEVRGPQCSSVTQALNVKASCNTGSASNGFGTGINFGTSDTGTTCGWPNIDCSYTLGTINVVRTGGSQTGDMYFMTSNGGSLSEKFRIYAGGDFRSVGNLTMNNGSPTIYFQDSDNRSAMIHNNSNIFYVLRGCGNNSTSWCTYNGVWPLEINLENNNASFGGDIYSTGAGKWLSNTITKSGDTVDGVIYFRSNKGSGSYVGSNSSYQLEAYSSDGGAAGMSFHRGGYYAVNMGLDPDNVFRIGGWSAGSNRWQLDMSGNETLAGNLYANGGYVYGAGGAIYLQDLNGSGSRNTSVNGALLRSGMVMGNSTIGYGLHLNSHLWNWGGDPMYFTAGNFQFRTVIGNNNYTNLGNFSGDASNWNINQNNVTDTWMNFNGGSYARFIMSASGDWDGRNIWTWYVRTEPTPHKLRLISDTGAEVVTFANNGNVGFGLGGSNPSYRLQLASDSAGKPNGGSWANSSDQRLKKDVKDISGQEALDKLSKLQGKTFEWINPEEHSAKSGEVRASVMAQNLKEVFPQWVTEIDASGKDKGLVGSDGKAYSISYPNDFNAYLIEAIKELKKQNEELSQKVKDLEAAIK